MLWIWLRNALYGMLRLLIPPRSIPGVMNPNRACTVCGNRGGKLKFERVPVANYQDQPGHPWVRHTCSTCGFEEFLKPLGVPTHPAV